MSHTIVAHRPRRLARGRTQNESHIVVDYRGSTVIAIMIGAVLSVPFKSSID